MSRTAWFDRTFDFPLPAERFPAILERLGRMPAQLEALVKELPADILTKQVDGQWSIQEHIGHLFDLEELHDGRVDDYLNRAEVLRPADVKNKKTHTANHNAVPIETILSAFRKSREHFVTRLERLADDALHQSAMHPRLKQPMGVVDFAYFIAEHDDHHLASMRELSTILRRRASP